MFRINNEKLDEMFSKIAEKQTLYIPTDTTNGTSEFKKWNECTKLSKKLNTVRSAKDFFFPQTENLVEFKLSGKNIDVVDIREESEDFVIFGVRACDAKSFKILDSVYLTEPVDSYYKNRRDHATVIATVCTKPSETCFCTTFGIDPASPEADVACCSDDVYTYFESFNDKGDKFIDSVSDMLEECDSSASDAIKTATRNIMPKLPLSGLSTESFGSDKLNELFNSDKWKELSESCLGCGSCTFVCPTCQCYDIKDYDTGHGIKRYRCWDSCMYSEFTKMAHGNPRPTQTERFRQRFMHKLVYHPANNKGEFGCVGCGRCILRCPISMNIVKVMKALEVKKDE